MKDPPQLRVVRWLVEHRDEISVNPTILGEIEFGILILPAGRHKSQLESWFQNIIQSVPVQVFDSETARIWARLMAGLRRKGRTMPLNDSLIAATALQHDLAVATRDVLDYRFAGVQIENPFKS